jgi:hypothetical protein
MLANDPVANVDEQDKSLKLKMQRRVHPLCCGVFELVKLSHLLPHTLGRSGYLCSSLV